MEKIKGYIYIKNKKRPIPKRIDNYSRYFKVMFSKNQKQSNLKNVVNAWVLKVGDSDYPPGHHMWPARKFIMFDNDQGVYYGGRPCEVEKRNGKIYLIKLYK